MAGELSGANYLALARGMPPASAAVCAVVRQAVADPDVHVFGELLTLPAVAALADSPDPDHVAVHRTLRLFAFGSFRDYLQRADSYPPLSDPELDKLRRLSLLSAFTSPSVTMPDQLHPLGLTSVRQLQDLAIDARNRGILPEIRIADNPPVLRLTSAVPLGRDLPPDHLPAVSRTLRTLAAKVRHLAEQLEVCSAEVRSTDAALAAKKEQEDNRKDTLEAQQTDRDGMALDGVESAGVIQRTEKRRKGRHGQ